MTTPWHHPGMDSRRTRPFSRFAFRIALRTPLLLLPFLTGCVSPWPPLDPNASDWTWYQPKPLASTEMAVSTLKNLQNQFGPATGIPYRHTTSMEFDPFSMRIKWQWTEHDMLAKEVPAPGGVYQTLYSATQSQNERTLGIPFTQIDGFSIYLLRQHDPNNPREPILRWFLMVHEDDHPQMVEKLYVPDELTAQRLADALATMAIAQGRKVDGRRSFGAQGLPITPLQQQALGPAANQGGILVHEVAKGSQAERNGLQPMDVIIAVNGQSTPDVPKAIRAFRLEPGKPKVTYLRRERSTGANGKPVEQVVQRTEVFER